MDMIAALQAWYAGHCDGDWEHQGGIRIETLDNPGWSIVIDFDGVRHGVDGGIARRGFRRSDTDWAEFRYDDGADALRIACGPENLGEVLRIFLDQA